jgi:hypothetical protein
LINWNPRIQKLAILVTFALAMGYVEGVVVVYLKLVLPAKPPPITSRDVILSLGFFAFLSKSVIQNAYLVAVERTREAATLIMLLSVALLSSTKRNLRIAAFFFTFSVWDLSYYTTLFLWTGWPQSLLTVDVYFLLPVPWAGPVATPIIASLIIGSFSAMKLLKG